MTTTEPAADQARTRVRLGLAIMLVGFALMAYRLDVWELDLSRHLWPLIPISLGVVRVIAPPVQDGRRSIRSGMWLIYIGAWGLVSEYRLWGLNYGTSWPLLIIGVGLNMVWQSLETPPRRNAQEN